MCHCNRLHNWACLSSIYRAPARGWRVLGNCPNLAKILFVQRLALRSARVFQEQLSRLPLARARLGPAGSAALPAGAAGGGSERAPPGALPAARSIPAFPGESRTPPAPPGRLFTVTAFTEGVLIVSLPVRAGSGAGLAATLQTASQSRNRDPWTCKVLAPSAIQQ